MSIVMMGKTGYTCIRYLLCSVNLFFWVLGCCILSVGIWLNVSLESYVRMLPSYHLLSADNLSIFAGVLMLGIGFCGCCGAWFQNKCLLGTYLTAIVAVMLLEVAAGTLGFVFRSGIKSTLRQELMAGVRERYALDDNNGLLSTWDQIQVKFNCCGVDEHSDWYKIKAWPDEEWVPESCCIPSNGSETLHQIYDEDSNRTSTDICGRDMKRDASRIKTSGCFNKIRFWVLEHLHLVGLTCIIFAFIQFFAIVSALLVVCTMDFKKRFRPRNGSCRPTYNRVPTL
jgi:hypothetical protein